MPSGGVHPITPSRPPARVPSVRFYPLGAKQAVRSPQHREASLPDTLVEAGPLALVFQAIDALKLFSVSTLGRRNDAHGERDDLGSHNRLLSEVARLQR